MAAASFDAIDWNYWQATGAFFGAKQHPFRVIFRAEQVTTCDDELWARGFTRVDDLPGMSLSELLRCVPERGDVVFRPVSDPASLEDFRQTAFLGFGPPAPVGYRDGEPVCTSALYESQGVEGIDWVAAFEALRRSGLGEAATWAAVAEGRRRGYAIASLQASAMGRPVYARMGFSHDRSHAQYGTPQPASGARDGEASR